MDKKISTPDRLLIDGNHLLLRGVSPSFRPLSSEQHPSRMLTIHNFLSSVNLFISIKNWPQFLNLCICLLMFSLSMIHLIYFFKLGSLISAILFSMFILNGFSTLYYHRFCSHNAFRTKSKISSFFIKNLAPNLFNEETFALAHHVHHLAPESILDPHKGSDGFLHNYLADFTQMKTENNLSKDDFEKLSALVKHIPIKKNNYDQYKKWGAILNPISFVLCLTFNWAIWFGCSYLIGGFEALSWLGLSSFFWCVFVRNFNYKSHGSGKNKKIEGRDFDTKSNALNLWLPGMLCGEWHDNHHCYPKSSNCAFLPYQIDLTFVFIVVLKKIGLVHAYHNQKDLFIDKYINKERMQHE